MLAKSSNQHLRILHVSVCIQNSGLYIKWSFCTQGDDRIIDNMKLERTSVGVCLCDVCVKFRENPLNGLNVIMVDTHKDEQPIYEKIVGKISLAFTG
jgi:hypothetical protein